MHFERQETGEKVFDVHVVNLRNTYQFTPQFLIRAILQYDSSRRRVLGDFLASYELVPGTVVHAGYGSLWERLEVDPYRPRRGRSSSRRHIWRDSSPAKAEPDSCLA